MAGPHDEALPANLGSPARNALAQADITNLRQVARHTAQEILTLHGVGPTAIVKLRAALAAQGRSFRDE